MPNSNPTHIKVLYDHDRVCCVCRNPAIKWIQIHHIDGNHDNDEYSNLAVLCQHCHTETQITGGFFRKLSPDLVTCYRDEWIEIVHKKRQSLLPQYDSYTPLQFPTIEELILQFLQPFHDNRILPLGTTFYFEDYYFLTPGFPTIVATSDNSTPETGYLHKAILKAYLLCVLGLIAPRGMLVSIFDPSQPFIRVQVGKGTQIPVPVWLIAGFEELSPLHLTGDYDPDTNQILLTFAPMIRHANLNYDLIGVKLEKIAQELKGQALTL